MANRALRSCCSTGWSHPASIGAPPTTTSHRTTGSSFPISSGSGARPARPPGTGPTITSTRCSAVSTTSMSRDQSRSARIPSVRSSPSGWRQRIRNAWPASSPSVLRSTEIVLRPWPTSAEPVPWAACSSCLAVPPNTRVGLSATTVTSPPRLAAATHPGLPPPIAADSVQHTWKSYSETLERVILAAEAGTWIAAVTCPVRLVAGDRDRVVDLDFLRSIQDEHDNVIGNSGLAVTTYRSRCRTSVSMPSEKPSASACGGALRRARPSGGPLQRASPAAHRTPARRGRADRRHEQTTVQHRSRHGCAQPP